MKSTNLLCVKIVGMEEMNIPSSHHKAHIHRSLVVTCTIALYSTLALVCEMVGCFFEIKDTRFGPRNTHEPVVESGH